jgi:hypothetical protein
MTTVLWGGMVMVGCDDNVEVLRDQDVRITKGMTWAWRPMKPPGESANRGADGRPILSKDVIGTTPPPPQQHLESNRDWNTEANRKQLQSAIEGALKSKGLVQVPDPATADFLVDYHLAVKTQRATVQTVYPGAYPGVVCGPYGCWSGWGWGPPGVGFQNVQFHEGTFVFDLALRNPKKLAYRAISRKELNKRSISPYQAEEAVNHLLKSLKPQ